ncbi:patched domain-containing protein 3-like [Anneissia japonica]|uniref:patched domain-containing protein 3-like n=1 Tax=Anneissia japonica TaxID=1529436 RepID=UPI001425A91A|nr:patched domain-containing protein 3-like [Anneissia japonica]
MVQLDCLEKPLASVYGRYGKFVARHPIPFLIFPVLITIILGIGMIYLDKTTDIEELFTPRNGEAKDERDVVESLFVSGNNLTVNRLTTLGRYGRMIIVAKDGGDILRDNILAELHELRGVVQNISIIDENKKLTFDDICLQWLGECNRNEFFLIFPDGATRNEINFTYPMYNNAFIGSTFGGVEFESDTDIVSTAIAIQLNFYLRVGDAIADKWEDKFLETIESFDGRLIDVYRYTSRSIEQELENASDEVFASFAIAFTIIINFAIWTSIRLDNVQNKPWLALMGVASAGLAVVSAFGLLMYCGVPFIDIVASTPILILSIGVDDMFIMISSWRKTNVRAPVDERMGEAMSEAALSITITSVTDALAFGVGVLAVFPSVQIFCAYTGVAVLFDYLYQVTFFAACMAISGKRENANRHYGTCLRVRPMDESPSKFYAICCSGGPSRKTSADTREESPHAVMVFFRDFFGPFVTHPATKVVAVIIYLAYIGVSIWGITELQQGLQLRNLALDDSYVEPYYDLEERYFKEYGPIVFVVFPEELNVLEPEINDKFMTILETFEKSEFTYGENFTDCWLRSFMGFLDVRNISSSNTDLLDVLRNEFLVNPSFERFSMDVVFGADGAILASRCLVTTEDINTSNRERDMMINMRDIADQSNYNITVYHPAFIIFDQYTAVLSNTLQNLGIALGAMLLVALIFIPQPICSVWVVFCILSIETGVIGFMSHWDVSLDSISMINLILCIGFSVDFSAHIAYTFTVSEGSTKNERIIKTLYSLGMPILQGALSTVVGIAVLSSSNGYIFRIFFKTLFLVIMLGLLHSMFFLPILLTLLGGGSKSGTVAVTSKTDSKKESASGSPHTNAYQNGAYDVRE